MAATQLHAFIRHLRSVLRAEGDGGLRDADLVERYTTLRDEAAFEVLLWRHGPMVIRVCQRLLGNEEDIEDAFQATFLTLARKASSLTKRESIGSWLYKVAYRIALDARAFSARLSVHEKAVATLPAVESVQDVPQEVAQREVCGYLDAEIQRLPRKYRDPVVLCHLEGKTQEEAAQELGWAKGTVSTRLIHARELLRRRLQRHGEAFPATALLPVLAGRALPVKLAQVTLRAVFSVQTPSAAGRLISAKALALCEAALKALALSQWKFAAALLLIVVSLGTGVGWLAYQGLRASPGASDAAGVSQAKDWKADAGLPSALGKLDPSRIPPEDRFAWQPPELVSVLGEHRGHSWERLDAVAFSPDGKLIASCGDGPTVRLWDAATLRQCAALTHPTQSVYCVAFSPDGKILAAGGSMRSGTDHKTLVLWNMTASPPTVRTVLKLSELLCTLAFSPDGNTLACGGFQGIRMWNIAGDREPQQLSLLPQAHTISLTYSADGKTLIAGDSDGNVLLWDLSTGTRRAFPKLDFPFGLRSVAVSPDGKLLACAGDATRPSQPFNNSDRKAEDVEPRRYSVILWDLTDPDHPRKRALVSKPTWQVFAVKFSPDGKTLATGNHDHTLRLWSLDGAEPTERAIIPTSSWIMSLDFSRDGNNLVVGHGSGLITLWDMTTPVPTERFSHRGHRATVYTMKLARTGLLVSGGYDSTLRFWNLAGVQAKERFSLKGYPSTDGLSLSQDGKALAFDNGGGAMEVWDVGAEKPRKRLQWSAKTKESGFYSLQLSPDGKVLISTGPDNLIHFWDLATDPPRERNHMKGFAISHTAAFSENGKSASIPSDDPNSGGVDFALWESGPVVRIWDVTLRTPGGDPNYHVYTVTFPPAGSQVGRRTKQPEVLAEPLLLEEGKQPPRKSLRLEGSESAIRGEREKRNSGHHQRSRSAIWWGAASPDGQSLASAARDGKVILWEATTGAKYREWQLPGTVYRVVFADDGRHLITANANGTLYVLRLGHGLQAPTDLSVLWETLSTGSAAKAYPAIWSLVATPRRTVAFFKDHLKPAKTLPAEDIEQLIARLDSNQFQERARATADLEELREQAEPALRRRLVKQPLPLELWQRIEGILKESKPISPERLRALRAIQVLEQIGNRDAQALLQHLAQGAAQAPQTEQAKAALKRMVRP
jgi:RNA polymerase sigma factor (sigma-70 family)